MLGDNAKVEAYQFIKEDLKESNKVFRGKPNIEKADSYSLNKDAFKHIESYIEIMDPEQNNNANATASTGETE